jgi:hypothetical protein
MESIHLQRRAKKLGIPVHELNNLLPWQLSEAYRAWGNANGVNVTFRLQVRKYCMISVVISTTVFIVSCLFFLPSPPTPSSSLEGMSQK